MTDTYHIDDLDGAVTLFKSYTVEGTETIAVFDEEHREVIQDLLTEINRLRNICGVLALRLNIVYSGGPGYEYNFSYEEWFKVLGGEEE